MTVGELFKRLAQFPVDYLVYAYEGEDTGVVVCDRDGREVDIIQCSEFDVREALREKR